MLNIALFDADLTDDAEELSTTDPRLSDVLSLVATDRFTEAAEAAEKLWTEKYYDIRLIGYFLFGAFLEQGLDVLPDLMSCVLRMLGQNWTKLGPKLKKETHADNACKWNFSRLVHELKLHERLSDDTWKTWNGAEAAAVLRETLGVIPDLHERIANRLEHGKSLPYLQQLEAMLARMERSAESIRSGGARSSRDEIRVGFSMMTDEDESSEKPSEGVEGGADSEGDDSQSSSSSRSSSSSGSSSGRSSSSKSPSSSSSGNDSSTSKSDSNESSSSSSSSKDSSTSKSDSSSVADDEDEVLEVSGGDDNESESKKSDSGSSSSKESSTSAGTSSSEDEDTGLPSPTSGSKGTGQTIPVSPALAGLIRKIEAFGKLTRAQNFQRAAVVANDILRIFESFDARTYLPSVFSPFFAALAKGSEKLEPLLEEDKSLKNRALRHLYEVDLDAFVKGGKP